MCTNERYQFHWGIKSNTCVDYSVFLEKKKAPAVALRTQGSWRLHLIFRYALCVCVRAGVRACVCAIISHITTLSTDLMGKVIAFRPLLGQLLPRLRACPVAIAAVWQCSGGRGRKTGQERVRAWPFCHPAWHINWLTVSSGDTGCACICACSSRRFSENHVRKMKKKPRNLRLAAKPK